jgi:hypothetical protein
MISINRSSRLLHVSLTLLSKVNEKCYDQILIWLRMLECYVVSLNRVILTLHSNIWLNYCYRSIISWLNQVKEDRHSYFMSVWWLMSSDVKQSHYSAEGFYLNLIYLLLFFTGLVTFLMKIDTSLFGKNFKTETTLHISGSD